MLLRQLEIREAVFESLLPEPDRTMLTVKIQNRGVKQKLILQGPQGLYGVLVALLSLFVGQDVCKAGKALADLRPACKQYPQSQKAGEIRKKNQRKRSLWVTLREMWQDVCQVGVPKWGKMIYQLSANEPLGDFNAKEQFTEDILDRTIQVQIKLVPGVGNPSG